MYRRCTRVRPVYTLTYPGAKRAGFWSHSGMFAGTKPARFGHTRVCTPGTKPVGLGYTRVCTRTKPAGFGHTRVCTRVPKLLILVILGYAVSYTHLTLPTNREV